MQIRWSAGAATDLEDIAAYIGRDNPTAAERVTRSIYDGLQVLGRFPYLGR